MDHKIREDDEKKKGGEGEGEVNQKSTVSNCCSEVSGNRFQVTPDATRRRKGVPALNHTTGINPVRAGFTYQASGRPLLLFVQGSQPLVISQFRFFFDTVPEFGPSWSIHEVCY